MQPSSDNPQMAGVWATGGASASAVQPQYSFEWLLRGLSAAACATLLLAQAVELVRDLGELLVREMLESDEVRARLGEAADQLVQFQLHRRGVPVLGVLDQEDDQERADRRGRRREHEPRIGEVDERPDREPHQDGRDRKQE